MSNETKFWRNYCIILISIFALVILTIPWITLGTMRYVDWVHSKFESSAVCRVSQ